MYDHKCSYWRRDGSLPAKRLRVCVADNDNTRVMLALLRIIEADQVDLDVLVGATGGSNYRSIRDAQAAISVRNELKAMALLRGMCDEHLQAYPTSYEADCALISGGTLAPFSNHIHALIQVRGEKEVLLFYRDFAEVALQILRIEDPQLFHDGIEKIQQTKHAMLYQYCRNTVLRLRQEEERVAAGGKAALRHNL